MSTQTLLIILLVLLLIGVFPAWPYSKGWGFHPFGIIAIVILAIILFRLLG